MSGTCPVGQHADAERTAFGECLDLLRTPRVRTDVPASARIPTRPDPTVAPDPSRVRAVSAVDQNQTANSPSPKRPPSTFTHEPTVLRTVWQTLLSGLHSLSLNDYTRPWPYPVRADLLRLVGEFDGDLCVKAAVEAKSIVQAQDRAPNITGLFEKKLRDLVEVRETVRRELAVAGGER